MNRALGFLVGEHDFKPFQSSGARPGPTVRKILEAEAVPEPIAFPGGLAGRAHLVRIRIVGTGFLKQMVRGIAGTLLQIGEGRRDPESTREILVSGDRKKVGPTAPGRALWLEEVWYPSQFALSWQPNGME
jgi:tRNA pseudouridine38-40 synthase